MTPGSSRRLRITIVAASYPTDADPVSGVFVQDQAAALSERHDVVVVVPRITVASRRPSTWPALAAALRASRHQRAATDRRIPTARPVAFSVFRSPGFTERSYERAIELAPRRVGGWVRPDVIHAHVVLPAGLRAVRLGRSLGVPVVLTEHSSPFSVHLQTEEDRLRVLETLQGADRVLAVGPALRDEMLGVASVPIDIVANVVARDFFAGAPHRVRPAGPDRALRVVGIGYLVPQKRFDILLDAAAMVSPDRLPLEIVIVGGGPLRDTLAQQASDVGLADRVRFVPMGPRSDLLPWLAWCDVLVSTSDHESFGLVVAEALATGRPVVTTASGGPEAFVDPDVGIVVPCRNAAALAGAIERLPAFLATFRPEVSRHRMAVRFGPDVFLDRMTAIYDEVIARKRPSAGGRAAMPEAQS